MPAKQLEVGEIWFYVILKLENGDSTHFTHKDLRIYNVMLLCIFYRLLKSHITH